MRKINELIYIFIKLFLNKQLDNRIRIVDFNAVSYLTLFDCRISCTYWTSRY